jgi:copper ion binding protein
MKEAVIKVEGMMCEHCVGAVTRAVTALEGVSAVAVSLEAGTATVKYEPEKVGVEAIKAAIEEQGYDVI